MKLEELPLLDIFNSLRQRHGLPLGIDEYLAVLRSLGAARGNFDQERVESTKVWIEQLQQSVCYSVWLNPMPNECWQHTTAGEIKRLVPMFEMSRQGMNAAISILRGRYFVDIGE